MRNDGGAGTVAAAASYPIGHGGQPAAASPIDENARWRQRSVLLIETERIRAEFKQMMIEALKREANVGDSTAGDSGVRGGHSERH